MDDLLIIPQTELLTTGDLVLQQIVVKDRELVLVTTLEVLEPVATPAQVLDVTQPALILEVGLQGPPGAPGASAAAPTVTFPAAAALGGHRAVRLVAGKAAYANAAASGDANLVLGITTGAAVLDAPTTIQTAGPMTEPSWAWTPDAPVFCGPAGTLTQTPPTSGFSLVLGIALSAIQIHIGQKMPIALN